MLKKIYKYTLNITLLSGMHIGGSSDSFDIGGADSSVIKNPITKEPYIPGSSLKGKLRSLLVKENPMIVVHGEEKDLDFNEKDKEAVVFSNLFQPVKMNEDTIQSTRAIFRDAVLTPESKKDLQNFLGADTYTEIKAENKISILKGTAETPRFIERVPAGAKFKGEIILQIYDTDDEETLKKGIETALERLQDNYLGASGTRGYGEVKVDYKSETVYENKGSE